MTSLVFRRVPPLLGLERARHVWRQFAHRHLSATAASWSKASPDWLRGWTLSGRVRYGGRLRGRKMHLTPHELHLRSMRPSGIRKSDWISEFTDRWCLLEIRFKLPGTGALCWIMSMVDRDHHFSGRPITWQTRWLGPCLRLQVRPSSCRELLRIMWGMGSAGAIAPSFRVGDFIAAILSVRRPSVSALRTDLPLAHTAQYFSPWQLPITYLSPCRSHIFTLHSFYAITFPPWWCNVCCTWPL